jgi:hypothetical protein
MKAVLQFEFNTWDDTAVMHCPITGCPSDNVHFDEVELVGSTGRFTRLTAPPEDSDHQPGITQGEHPNGRWLTRRQAVVLIGWCEYGHNFELGFVQHKGDTEVSIQRQPDRVYEEV